MIIVTLRLKVVPEKRWAVLKTVHTIIGPTTVRSGCSHCSLYSNTSNDDELILLEKWESQEAMEGHICSDEFRKVMSAMEAACEPPEMQFSRITSAVGMKLVEEILTT